MLIYVLIIAGCLLMAFVHTLVHKIIQGVNLSKIEELKTLNMLADLHLNTIASLNVKLDTIGFKNNFDVEQLILEQEVYIKESQDVIEGAGMVNQECSLFSVVYVLIFLWRWDWLKKINIQIKLLYSIAFNWQKEIDEAMAKKIIL